MSRPFLDSNVLIYSVKRDDPRRLIAGELIGRGGTISVQSLNEFVSVTRRKLNIAWSEVTRARDLIIDLCAPVAPLTVDIHKHGAGLAERYKLSIYDGMIVAAALTANCDTLYSEDMHNGLVIDGRLRIVNPFAPA